MKCLFLNRLHGGAHLSPYQFLLFAFNSVLPTAENKMGVVLSLGLDMHAGRKKKKKKLGAGIVTQRLGHLVRRPLV